MDDFRVAIVYGKSVKHQPQRVGLSHELADEDISKRSASSIRLLLILSSHDYQALGGTSLSDIKPPKNLQHAKTAINMSIKQLSERYR